MGILGLSFLQRTLENLEYSSKSFSLVRDSRNLLVEGLEVRVVVDQTLGDLQTQRDNAEGAAGD